MASRGASDVDLMTRFASLGSEAGYYNVLSEHEYTAEDTGAISSLMEEERGHEALRLLKRIVQSRYYISKEPVLYALAKIIRISSLKQKHQEDQMRREAYRMALELCESPTDLFTFVHYDKKINSSNKPGWGRGMRKLVAKWYEEKSAEQLAREVTKCKSAKGWTHRDLIRLTHICPTEKSKGSCAVLHYLAQGKEELKKFQDTEDEGVKGALSVIEAVEKLNQAKDTEIESVRGIIEERKLVQRQIPTHFYRYKESYEGMLGHMPLVEVVRHVPKMAALGMLNPYSPPASRVLDRLNDVEAIKENKLSAVTIFAALRKYDTNRMKKWLRNSQIVNALKVAYSKALELTPKTGKRFLLAVHVNAKIMKGRVSGSNMLTPIMPCVVLAQMISSAEETYTVVFFSNTTTELKITKAMDTAHVVEEILRASRSPTNDAMNVAEPLKWATKEKKVFDNIIIVSEKKVVSTPEVFHTAVQQYRQESPEAKVAVVGLNDFTQLCKKDDLNLLDVTGFNETVPPLLYQFFQGLPENDGTA